MLIFSGGSIAYAQDASLSTPPELRDFRLDSPPQTAPGPEVRPQLPKQSTQDAPPPAPQPTTQLEPAPVVQEQRSPVAQPQRVQPIRPDDAPQDAQAASWAFEHHEPSGSGTPTLPSAPGYYLPLTMAGKPVGVLGLSQPLPQHSALLDAVS